MFITIVGVKYFPAMQLTKVGMKLCLEKEIDNPYDDEAIKVKSLENISVGYVANSIDTVAKGTYSAGRIYDRVENEQIIQVLFILHGAIIAEVMEVIKE